MDLSVIIVNYNTESYLKDCLYAILKFTKGIKYEIIVVDNNSTNRSIETFPSNFPDCKFIFLEQNKGFGYGNNYGFRNISDSKYICLLNPDILLTDNSLLDLFNFLENNTEYAVCSGYLMNDKGEPEYTYNNFPGFKWFLRESIMAGTKKAISELNKRFYQSKNREKYFDVDWVMGACLFMRSNVFKEVKGFDENIFLYYEDTDLQLRIKNSKYKIACLPGVRFIHYSKSSIRNENIEDTYHLNMHKARAYYINKHFGLINRSLFKMMFVSGIMVRICILPFNKKYSGLRKLKYVQLKSILRIYS